MWDHLSAFGKKRRSGEPEKKDHPGGVAIGSTQKQSSKGLRKSIEYIKKELRGSRGVIQTGGEPVG